MKFQAAAAFAISAFFVGANAADASKGLLSRKTGKSLRPAAEEVDDSVVKPLQFRQMLLVCNAYPSEEPAIVNKNGKELEMETDTSEVAYGHCTYSKAKVETSDKLDFILRGSERQGTFEIGELPQSDTVLLLVVQRRDSKSPLIGFQSYAFPLDSEEEGAQLAIIDAFKGNTSHAGLRMEDHIVGKQDKAIAKRSELLKFDRVYSIEPGTYDAFIEDHAQASFLSNTSRQTCKLNKNKNYVIMRMGDSVHFAQSLMVFPSENSAAAAKLGSAFIIATILAFTSLLA